MAKVLPTYTGSIFVENGFAISTLIAHDGEKFTFHLRKDDGAVTYLAELHLITVYVAYLLDTQKLNEGDLVKVFTSNPVLAKHLSGDAVPQKIEAIRMHDALEASETRYDFLVMAEHKQSKLNPAQYLAKQEKDLVTNNATR